MAVLHSCPGLEVEVLVDGQPLPEYADEEASTAEGVTNYVPAQSGAEFSLRTKFIAPFPFKYGVKVTISVDGVRQRYLYESHKMFSSAGLIDYGVSFKEGDTWYRRNYCFTALDIGTL